MSFISIKFLIYLTRWIISAFVMMIPLYFLQKYNCCEGKYKEYLHLIIIQIIGAFIFFYIDGFIFK